MKINKTLENPIYFGAKPNILDRAKELRKNMTDTEKLLWCKLNKRQLCGYKFRRQHPILQFVADFYCHEAKLIVEVDGGYHQNEEQIELDVNRTFELEQLDIKVIRFTNEEVLNNIETVVEKIKEELVKKQSNTHPSNSPNGEDGQCASTEIKRPEKYSAATSMRLSPQWGEMSTGQRGVEYASEKTEHKKEKQ